MLLNTNISKKIEREKTTTNDFLFILSLPVEAGFLQLFQHEKHTHVSRVCFFSRAKIKEERTPKDSKKPDI
jgi:hypothetical protein